MTLRVELAGNSRLIVSYCGRSFSSELLRTWAMSAEGCCTSACSRFA